MSKYGRGRSGKPPDKKLHLECFPKIDMLLFLELPAVRA